MKYLPPKYFGVLPETSLYLLCSLLFLFTSIFNTHFFKNLSQIMQKASYLYCKERIIIRQHMMHNCTGKYELNLTTNDHLYEPSIQWVITNLEKRKGER